MSLIAIARLSLILVLFESAGQIMTETKTNLERKIDLLICVVEDLSE